MATPGQNNNIINREIAIELLEEELFAILDNHYPSEYLQVMCTSCGINPEEIQADTPKRKKSSLADLMKEEKNLLPKEISKNDLTFRLGSILESAMLQDAPFDTIYPMLNAACQKYDIQLLDIKTLEKNQNLLTLMTIRKDEAALKKLKKHRPTVTVKRSAFISNKPENKPALASDDPIFSHSPLKPKTVKPKLVSNLSLPLSTKQVKTQLLGPEFSSYQNNFSSMALSSMNFQPVPMDEGEEGSNATPTVSMDESTENSSALQGDAQKLDLLALSGLIALRDLTLNSPSKQFPETLPVQPVYSNRALFFSSPTNILSNSTSNSNSSSSNSNSPAPKESPRTEQKLDVPDAAPPAAPIAVKFELAQLSLDEAQERLNEFIRRFRGIKGDRYHSTVEDDCYIGACYILKFFRDNIMPDCPIITQPQDPGYELTTYKAKKVRIHGKKVKIKHVAKSMVNLDESNSNLPAWEWIPPMVVGTRLGSQGQEVEVCSLNQHPQKKVKYYRADAKLVQEAIDNGGVAIGRGDIFHLGDFIDEAAHNVAWMACSHWPRPLYGDPQNIMGGVEEDGPPAFTRLEDNYNFLENNKKPEQNTYGPYFHYFVDNPRPVQNPVMESNSSSSSRETKDNLKDTSTLVQPQRLVKR